MESKKPIYLIPEHRSLNDKETKLAVADLIASYPQVIRSMMDPPITNQVYGNISFMLFNEPKKLRTGKNVYGFVKVRGNWADEYLAKKKATDIVREHDSKYKIKICPVGHWMPITDEEAFVNEMLDVNTEGEDSVQLRDQAVKEKESEQRKVMREIREREEEAKKDDVYDDQESLTFYTMKRVTEMRLVENIEIKMNEVKSLEGKLVDTRRILKKLDVSHLSYNDQWIERYNVERRKSGIPDFKPSDKLLEEYNNWIDVKTKSESDKN